MHDQLREATSQLHRSAEAQLDLLRADLSLDRYRSILEALYGYYLPLEARLQPAAALGFPLSSRAPRIERDLSALGASTDGPPSCDALPRIETAADLAGCLVLRGRRRRHRRALGESNGLDRRSRLRARRFGSDRGSRVRNVPNVHTLDRATK